MANARQDSDLDIAFISNTFQSDKYAVYMLAQQLASKLKRDVDLINLKEASTVFQAQILHTGTLIYCTDPQRKTDYESRTLKMYARLNEERMLILKNIEESGSVYGK